MGYPFSVRPTQVRSATRADARFIAQLGDMAGEGLPSHLWAQTVRPGETSLDIGTARAARDMGAFSWTNTRIALSHGAPVGAILDYDIDTPEVWDAPALLAPLLALEMRAAHTRYINILAVIPQSRNKGVASLLLADVAARTDRDVTLIVASENRVARGLYIAKGFDEIAREPMGPGGPPGLRGDWILMRRKAQYGHGE